MNAEYLCMYTPRKVAELYRVPISVSIERLHKSTKNIFLTKENQVLVKIFDILYI